MRYTTDYLVLGSGIAGLTCALECSRMGRRVVLVTKDRLPESSSRYAQGGIASVWSPEDSFEAHIADTLAAGDGLCHPDIVEVVVRAPFAGVVGQRFVSRAKARLSRPRNKCSAASTK